MTQARYDAVADFYVSGFDSTDDPATRALLNLLGPAAGLRVVDVACGHGRITRELARRGAQAVGIDISANLISKARENEENEPLGLRYLHADITVADRITVAGTNTYRQDSTGKTASQSYCKMYQVADGRIVRFWGEQDLFGLLVGLDMLPDTKPDFG